MSFCPASRCWSYFPAVCVESKAHRGLELSCELGEAIYCSDSPPSGFVFCLLATHTYWGEDTSAGFDGPGGSRLSVFGSAKILVDVEIANRHV